MPKTRQKRRRTAVGFLVDENVPADVSDYIAELGFRVAHIGRNEPYLVQAPPKGTPDGLLKKTLQQLILVTQDKRLLRAGALPASHRGVFVIDSAESTALNVTRELFDRTQWADDPVFVGRRFLVRIGRLEEVELDGSISNRYW